MPKFLSAAQWIMRSTGAARSIAGRLATKLKATVARSALSATPGGPSADAAVSFDPAPMASILGERATFEAQIEAGAQKGHVPDALTLCYIKNLDDEVAEHKRRLTETEHRLEASLRRLSARCPEALPPEPALPPPSRRRVYRSISDWFPRDGSGLPH